MLKFFDTVNKQQGLPLIQKPDSKVVSAQLQLLQQHIEFLPDLLKSVQENADKSFCFALT